MHRKVLTFGAKAAAVVLLLCTTTSVSKAAAPVGTILNGYTYPYAFYYAYPYYAYYSYPYFGYYTYPFSGYYSYSSYYGSPYVNTFGYGYYPYYSTLAYMPFGAGYPYIYPYPYTYPGVVPGVAPAAAGSVVPASFSEGDRSARITMRFPDANAELRLDGKLIESSGLVRSFVTPPLDPGRYSYDVQVTWPENNRKVSKSQRIEVTPGTQSEVTILSDFPQVK